jgi:hypothetical protein
MVILNKNKEAVQLDMKRYHEMLNGNQIGKDIISGENIKLFDKMEVPAKSAMIIEVD